MKLKSIKAVFLIVGLSALFTACQKEVDFQNTTNNPPPGGGTTNNSILGKWNFVSMVASTQSTLTAGAGIEEEKVITSYGFISKNNVGTVTIDATNFTSAGVGYSIDTVVSTELYMGGVFIDSFETDFTFTMPLSSGTVPYKAVGSDSIYFASGFINLDPKANPTAKVASGSKIAWSGDTLLLKTIYANTQNQVINGITAKRSDYISQVVKLKK